MAPLQLSLPPPPLTPLPPPAVPAKELELPPSDPPPGAPPVFGEVRAADDDSTGEKFAVLAPPPLPPPLPLPPLPPQILVLLPPPLLAVVPAESSAPGPLLAPRLLKPPLFETPLIGLADALPGALLKSFRTGPVPCPSTDPAPGPKTEPGSGAPCIPTPAPAMPIAPPTPPPPPRCPAMPFWFLLKGRMGWLGSQCSTLNGGVVPSILTIPLVLRPPSASFE